jgi:hypothetical protein
MIRSKGWVVWIGQPGTSQQDQVGVELMEPRKIIWEAAIRKKLD